jgi:hypothetical protein
MKIKYIGIAEVSKVKMASGNEKKFSKIIDPEVVFRVKEWVGFGWVDIREATADDFKKFKVVKRGDLLP